MTTITTSWPRLALWVITTTQSAAGLQCLVGHECSVANCGVEGHSNGRSVLKDCSDALLEDEMGNVPESDQVCFKREWKTDIGTEWDESTSSCSSKTLCQEYGLGENECKENSDVAGYKKVTVSVCCCTADACNAADGSYYGQSFGCALRIRSTFLWVAVVACIYVAMF